MLNVITVSSGDMTVVQYCDNKDEQGVQFHFRHIHHQLQIALHSTGRNQLALQNCSVNLRVQIQTIFENVHPYRNTVEWLSC